MLAQSYMMGFYLGRFMAAALIAGSVSMLIFLVKQRFLYILIPFFACGFVGCYNSVASIVVGVGLAIFAIIIPAKDADKAARKAREDVLKLQHPELRYRTPLMIIAAAVGVCLVISRCKDYINIIPDLFESANQPDYIVKAEIWYLLRLVIPTVCCVLFILFVFVFCKKSVGTVFLPIIYALIGLQFLNKLFMEIESMKNSLLGPSTSDILWLAFSLVLTAVCVMMVYLLCKAIYNKMFFAVGTTILIAYEMYVLYDSFKQYAVINELGSIEVGHSMEYYVNIVMLVLLYSGLFICCYFGKIPPVSNMVAARKQEKLLKKIIPIEGELRELDERLAEGSISREQYDYDSQYLKDKIRAIKKEADKIRKAANKTKPAKKGDKANPSKDITPPQKAKPVKRVKKPRDGMWLCPECEAQNFDRVKTCYNCGAKRPE